MMSDKQEVELITIELNKSDVKKILNGESLLLNVIDKECDDNAIKAHLYCSEPD